MVGAPRNPQRLGILAALRPPLITDRCTGNQAGSSASLDFPHGLPYRNNLISAVRSAPSEEHPRCGAPYWKSDPGRKGGAILHNPSKSRPRAFTLVELLIAIAIIAVLIALLLTVITRARRKARRDTPLSAAEGSVVGRSGVAGRLLMWHFPSAAHHPALQ